MSWWGSLEVNILFYLSGYTGEIAIYVQNLCGSQRKGEGAFLWYIGAI